MIKFSRMEYERHFGDTVTERISDFDESLPILEDGLGDFSLSGKVRIGGWLSFGIDA